MSRRAMTSALLCSTVVAAVVTASACSDAGPRNDSKASLPAVGPLDGALPPDFDAAALPMPPDGSVDRVWHAVVDVNLPGPHTLYALSDPHGGYDRLAVLLAAAKVTKEIPSSPEKITWTAGDAVLVVAGDLIDKGPQPLEVIDALRTLEVSAAAAGGLVVVLLGNHEAEFLFDPRNSKASASDGFGVALAARGLDPVAVAKGLEPHGAWLRERPLGAKVGHWFFSHAGNTKGRTLPALDLTLRSAIANHTDYADGELVGSDSILEARDWYVGAVAATNALALGVSHIVFGHDPNALGAKGAIALGQAGVLFRIDCGMSPLVNDSTGCVLRVHEENGVAIAEQLTANGTSKELWRGAP